MKIAIGVLAVLGLALANKCGEGEWIYSPELKACYWILGVDNYITNEVFCESNKGQPASIHSQKENDFIVKLGKLNQTLTGALPWDQITLLIGAQRKGDKFEWVDGTPFDYQNWAAGEPNNWKDANVRANTENEDCVSLYTDKIVYGTSNSGPQLPEPYVGRWNDNVCNQKYRGLVCKKVVA